MNCTNGRRSDCCAPAAGGHTASAAPRRGRKSRRFTCRSAIASGSDAGPLEIAVEMAFALLVALLEQPAIAAFRIGQDLPAIIVAIPEEEAVGAVLKMRLGDFLETPLLGLRTDDAVYIIYLFLAADIEPVVVEEVHFADVLTVNDGNGVGAAQSYEKRDRARLNDLETKKLLVEAARESKVAALQRAVRQKVELERRRRFVALRRCGCVSYQCHEGLHPMHDASDSEPIVAQRRNGISRRRHRQTATERSMIYQALCHLCSRDRRGRD